jgi:integrase/recombinase XerC
MGKADARTAVANLLSLPHGQANAIALTYKAIMVKRGLASATVARRLAALRSIVTLARTLGRINWALDVESPKVEPYRDTRGPGDDGWSKMIDRARVEAITLGDKGKRDLAIIRLIHALALRRSEVASLDMESLDLAGAVVHVVGKGRTDAKPFTLPPRTVAALREWVLVRGEEPGPLFYRLDQAGRGETGEHLTGEAIWHIVRNLGKRAGVGRLVWPHALRHHAVTSALDKTGGNIREVQQYSRHADPRTLMRYDDNRRDVAGRIAAEVDDD